MSVSSIIVATNAVLTKLVDASNYLRDVNLSGTLSVADLLVIHANQAQNLPLPGP